ncbi:hypothetical protein RB213_007139 [Colletotrichum asianum]
MVRQHRTTSPLFLTSVIGEGGTLEQTVLLQEGSWKAFHQSLLMGAVPQDPSDCVAAIPGRFAGGVV